MIKAILWDIDDTLLDFLPTERYAIRKCFSIFNIGECTDDMLSVYSEINKNHWYLMETGHMKKNDMLISRFKEFFSLYDIPISIAEEFNLEYQKRLGDKVFFIPGAYEVLNSLSGEYILCAATNGTKTSQSAKLEKAGLNSLFDYLFISEDIGFEKPDPRFFSRVFSTLGIDDHREVMIVGDSLSSDIKGGIDSGLVTCWYNPSRKVSESLEPDYIIEHLYQIKDILPNKDKTES